MLLRSNVAETNHKPPLPLGSSMDATDNPSTSIHCLIHLHAVMRSNFVGAASSWALPIVPGRQKIRIPPCSHHFPNFQGTPKYITIGKGRQNIKFSYFLITGLSIFGIRLHLLAVVAWCFGICWLIKSLNRLITSDFGLFLHQVYPEGSYTIVREQGLRVARPCSPSHRPAFLPALGAQSPKPQFPILKPQGKDPKLKFQIKLFEISKLKFLS